MATFAKSNKITPIHVVMLMPINMMDMQFFFPPTKYARIIISMELNFSFGLPFWLIIITVVFIRKSQRTDWIVKISEFDLFDYSTPIP